MAAIFGTFIIIGLLPMMGYGGSGLGNRLFGLGLTLVFLGLAIFDLSSRITRVNRDGFHVMLRRKILWRNAQWADLVDIVPGFIPNVTIRVVLKDKNSTTKQYDEFIIKGFAGFGSGKRQQEIVDQFNDWIAAADPSWIINPWLHQSNRPDNR